jgi:hypothetical protein
MCAFSLQGRENSIEHCLNTREAEVRRFGAPLLCIHRLDADASPTLIPAA